MAQDIYSSLFEQDDEYRARVNALQDRDPARVARARRVARGVNAPPALVEGEPEIFERMLRRRQVEESASDPALLRWLGDPDNAALARDDVPRMAAVSDLLRPWTDDEFADFTRRVGARPVNNLGERSARSAIRESLLGSSSTLPLLRRPSEEPFGDMAARIRARPEMDRDELIRREARRATEPIGANPFTVGRQFFAGTLGLGTQAAGGAGLFVLDALGVGEDAWLRGEFEETVREGQDIAQAYRIDTNWAGNTALGAGQMLFDMAAGGGLVRSGQAMAGLFGGVIGAEGYGRFRERGATPNEALVGGTITGGAEYIFERSPMGFLFGRYGSQGVTNFLTGYLRREVPSEVATTLVQSAADAAIANPGMTMQTWLRRVPMELLDTAAVTTLAGGVIGGGHRLQQIIRPVQRDMVDVEIALGGQQFLDRLMEEAGQSQVRELDPDTFSEFVHSRTDGTPIQNLYIPVEAVDTYLQSEGADTEFFEVHAEQIAEARRLGGDVVVPIGEAAARLAGTPVWQALREDVRVTPGGMSGREAREKARTFMQELETRGEEIAAEAQTEGEERAPVVAIYQRVKNELLSLGRSEREAEAIAQVFAARREAGARRLGVTVEEYDAARPVAFRVAEPGEKPGANALLAREDAPDAVVNIGLATNDGTGITREEAIAALEEIGVVIRSSQVAQSATEPTLVARLNRPLTRREGNRVSKKLRREAIAQAVGEAGDLFGPKAKDWGPFNPDFFLTEQQATAQDVMPRAGWSEERIGGLIDEYGYLDGSSKAYAVRMSPEEFLGLTASPALQRTIEGRLPALGEFSEEKLGRSNPIWLDVEFGQHRNTVMGHEGRHWMTMLKERGIQSVPVVVRVRNGKATKDRGSTELMPQRDRDSQAETPATVAEMIPISWQNRDRLLEMAGAGRVLFQEEQKDKGSVRGQAQFFPDGQAVVTLFETANLSTLIHELGHVFLEELAADAVSPNAPKELKEDFAKVRAWFAANGASVRRGEIPTAAHEMFARGFERYAMEGKAPSPVLRRAFAQFRAWLLRIYEVVQNLNAPITPEIREVFDRMLATEDAIAGNRGTEAHFVDAEQAGMTEAEWTAYTKSLADARDEAYDALLFKTMAAIRRREEQRFRDQRANVRGEVAADINSRPEFVVLHLLRTGRWLNEPDREPQRVKLNTGWLIDNYGEEVLGKLPRGLPIIHGEGVDGDTIAEMTGIASGDLLVKSLIAMREASDRLRAQGEKRSVRDMAIEHEVDRIMAERHGDAMTDGSIEEEAVDAINNARQGEIISGELRQLAKRKAALGGPTPYQIAREWARRKIMSKRLVDVASRAAIQRYTRATEKAGREFEAAILADDVDAAFRHKQAQLLNHALLVEAKAAADQADTIVARMQRYAKRKAMKSVDQDYFDRVHELLERFDFRDRSQKAITEKNQFEDWAERRRAEGFEVPVPPRLDFSQHFSRISMATLIELNDAVRGLIELGRLKQKLVDGQGERDFNEARDEIVANVEQLPDRKLPSTPVENEKRLGARAAAALLKVETIADELDLQDSNGPLNRLLVQGASRAANERDALSDKVLAPLAQLFMSQPRKWRKRMHDKVTSDVLVWNTLREGDPRGGQPVTMTRMEWLAVALNTGNLSNLEKMSKGERWPAPAIQAEVKRILTKEDWDFVQAIWNATGKLWPDIARVERQMSGVVPEQIEPLEIETPFGPYRGGYWPVVYDVNRSQRAENNADDEANDLFGFKSGIGTPKGHTITRTEAVGPLSYRLEEVLMNHMEKVVTRIAYAPWVRDVVRMIDNPKVRGIIDTKLGPEYRRQIKPWLRRQINSTMIDKRGAAWWDSVLRTSRTNMSIAVMGFAYSTGVAQTLGLGFSAGRIGPKYVALGLNKTLGKSGLAAGLAAGTAGFIYSSGAVGGFTSAAAAVGTAKATGALAEAENFVFSRSPEMARRGREMNREVVEVFQKLRGGRAGWHTNAQMMAFWHIAMIDRYMVAMPTWLGAHQKGMDEGMTDEEASAFADKIVRNSQGSGREKDLSAIQSPNSEAMRFFTMFYTPFNVMFNAQWDGVRAAKSGDWRRSVMLTSWFLLTTALADALMAGDWPGDDDEDLSFEALASWFGRNVFFSLWAGVPVARDVANYAERKINGDYSNLATPIESALTAVERAGTATYDVAFEDAEVTGRYVKQLATAGGYIFGLPGGQVGKTGGFLWDVQRGEANPETIADWHRGLTSGRSEAQE